MGVDKVSKLMGYSKEANLLKKKFAVYLNIPSISYLPFHFKK
jgi:hypothetical protein